LTVPSWYLFILLAFAAWRTFQLLAHDDILGRPRRYVTKRPKMADFMECPYCLGFWISVLWWAGFEIWPHGSVVLAVPFALSTALIGIQRLLSPD
jgi:Protein of unknown function (DUF1360)